MTTVFRALHAARRAWDIPLTSNLKGIHKKAKKNTQLEEIPRAPRKKRGWLRRAAGQRSIGLKTYKLADKNKGDNDEAIPWKNIA